MSGKCDPSAPNEVLTSMAFGSFHVVAFPGQKRSTARLVGHLLCWLEFRIGFFMTVDRQKQIADLYRAALERPRANRAAFVAERSKDDDALRRSVEELLHSANATEARDPHGAIAIGALIGSYRIDALLAEGGMGVVCRATDTKLNRRGRHQVSCPTTSRCERAPTFSARSADGLVAQSPAHSDGARRRASTTAASTS